MVPWDSAPGKWLITESTFPAAGLALSCSGEAAVVVSDSSIWHSFCCGLCPLTTSYKVDLALVCGNYSLVSFALLARSKQRHNKLWRSHSDSDLSDHHEPICKAGLELNKKEITTSADQISEAKTNDNQQPMSPIYSAELDREQQLPEDTNMIEDVCVKERRIHLEFTCRDFHAEQMEDKLNLNNINGCTVGCCVDSVPPDNCHASEALMQLQHPLEITEFPDLTVDDLEKDALKLDMNLHLVPMEEFTSCLKDFPQSPNQNSPGLQQNPQPEVTDLSTDRIDFFSALEKFVELSQESRSRTCSHSRPEEQGTGRNGVSRVPMLEVLPAADGSADALRNSPGNSPQASDDSSTDEEQQKVKITCSVVLGTAARHCLWAVFCCGVAVDGIF